MKHLATISCLALALLFPLHRCVSEGDSPPGSVPLRLPVLFAENVGQWHRSVLYGVQGQGRSLAFRRDGFSLLRSTRPDLRLPGERPERNEDAMSSRVSTLRFVRPSGAMTVEAGEKSPTFSRFYLGNDRSRWRERVANYRGLIYRNVWPGVDIAFSGNDDGRSERIVLQAGADARAVRFETDGDFAPRVTEAYQVIDGRTVAVEARFQRQAGGVQELLVGAHDAMLPMQVGIQFSTYFGGSGSESSPRIVLDACGIYLGGETNSVNLPVLNAVQKTNGGSTDLFLAKFTGDGQMLQFCTYFGSTGADYQQGMKAGAEGSILFMARPGGTAYPVTANAAIRNRPTNSVSPAITRFAADGALLYSSWLWMDGFEQYCPGFDTDARGCPYFLAHTYVTPSMTTPNAIFRTNQGTEDAFILKLRPTCDGIVYGSCYGGKTHEEPTGMIVDSAGNMFLTGTTGSGYPMVHPFESGSSGYFLSKISADGQRTVFSSYLQLGPALLETDDDGNLFLVRTAAKSMESSLALKNPLQSTVLGSYDMYIKKLSPAGDILFATYLGGSGTETPSTLATDPCGNLAISGNSYSVDFPMVNALPSWPNARDFITVIDSIGQTLAFSTRWGSNAGATALAFGRNCLVAAGVCDNVPTINPWQPTVWGGCDAFLSKISLSLCGRPDLRIGPPLLEARISVLETLRVERLRRYVVPDTFVVSVCIRNLDAVQPAIGITGRLQLPPELKLVPPVLIDTIPVTTLNTGDSAVYQWRVLLSDPLPTLGTLEIMFTCNIRTLIQQQYCSSFAADRKTLRIQWFDEPLLPLECSLTGPDTLVARAEELRMQPNPWTLTYALHNPADRDVTITSIALIVPKGMGLSTIPANDTLRSPGFIAAKSTYTTTWTIQATNLPTPRTVRFAVLVRDRWRYVVLTCEKTVTLPPLFSTTCAARGPAAIRYTPATGRTEPDSIAVSVLLENKVDTLQNYRLCEIDLSRAPHLALAAGETAGKPPFFIAYRFRRMLEWRLVLGTPPASNAADTVLFRWSAEKDPDIHYCQLVIPLEVLRSEVSCALAAPAALQPGTQPCSYAPNPFDARCVVRNLGSVAVNLWYAALTAGTNGDASVAPSDWQQLGLLAPGAADTVTWRVTAMTRRFPRTLPLSVSIVDQNSVTITTCNAHVSVPGVTDDLSCAPLVPDSLHYAVLTDRYTPDPFAATLVLGNLLDSEQDSLEARIDLAGAPHLKIAAGDSAPRFIVGILAHGSTQCVWQLATASSSDHPVSERIDVRYRHRGDTAWIACSRDIHIGGEQRIAALACSTAGHDTVWADKAYERVIPAPVQLQYTITNNGNAPAPACEAAIVLPPMYRLVNRADSIQAYPAILPGQGASKEWLLDVDPDLIHAGDETVRWVRRCDGIALDSSCAWRITLSLASPEGLVYSPWLLRFFAKQNEALPPAQTVHSWTGGALPSLWQLSSSASWLDYQPRSGSLASAIQVQPTSTALSAGVHATSIDFAPTPPRALRGIQVLYEIGTLLGTDRPATPSAVQLAPNYPNPAIGSTAIGFTLQVRCRVTIELYDTFGRRVALLLDADCEAGSTMLRFDASSFVPGVYSCVLRAGPTAVSRLLPILR